MLLDLQFGRRPARFGCEHSGTFPTQLGQEYTVCGVEYAAANGARGHVGGATASHNHIGVPQGSGCIDTATSDGAIVCADQCTKYTYNDQGAVAVPREGRC